MTEWLLAAAIGVLAAAIPYIRLSTPSAPARVGLGLLRAFALTLLFALLFDAPIGCSRPAAPWAFVDASMSMDRGRASLIMVAWDSARLVDAESTFVFGDSVRSREIERGPRAASRPLPPTDAATRVRPVVERSMAAGRPAVIFTDGEIEDSSALDGLAGGSRIVVLRRPPQRDAAVLAIDTPRAAVGGDSIAVRVTLGAGEQGASRGDLVLQLADRALGRWPVDEMSPWRERQLELRVRVAGQGATVLRAIVTTPGDAERQNDTLAATLEVSRAASAVFVSTSPDQDSRFALALLRGSLALPTRGFLRIAPGNWRHEGTLTPASEVEVRAALRDAPVGIFHGDTAVFGPPQSITVGPLALMAPVDDDESEWYPSAMPPSPLSGVLAALPLDSLSPITAGRPAAGDWVALEARRGREAVRRSVVSGRDSPRRRVTVTATGFWRWRFRGGASADAYAALWGGIFDWLAAERADRRGAVPDENVLRAGQPIRWRRGSAANSVVRVALAGRGTRRTDTLVLRFPSGSAIQESPPLARGTYDAVVPGGRTMLVVNASAELLPGRPRLQSGSVGGRVNGDDARPARGAGWVYVALVLLLCAEWIARRRAGLR